VPRKFNCGESYIVARFLQGVWEKRNNSVRSRNFSLAQKIGIFVFVGFSCRQQKALLEFFFTMKSPFLHFDGFLQRAQCKHC